MSLPAMVLAVILPPLAVALKYRLGVTFWINILLTSLGVIPGIFHAFYVLENGATSRMD